MKPSSDSADTKFSTVDTRDEELYNELERFVLWLAYKNQGDEVLMEMDELVGELLFEMAKGLRHYADLPKDQLKAVIRKMMDNRIIELRHKFYDTHRRLSQGAIHLEMDTDASDVSELSSFAVKPGVMFTVEELIEDEGSDPATIAESREVVRLTYEQLSDTAKKVFIAMLRGNARLEELVKLSAVRQKEIFNSDRVRIKTWQVAEGLLLQPRQVRRAFREIRRVYAEVSNG